MMHISAIIYKYLSSNMCTDSYRDPIVKLNASNEALQVHDMLGCISLHVHIEMSWWVRDRCPGLTLLAGGEF